VSQLVPAPWIVARALSDANLAREGVDVSHTPFDTQVYVPDTGNLFLARFWNDVDSRTAEGEFLGIEQQKKTHTTHEPNPHVRGMSLADGDIWRLWSTCRVDMIRILFCSSKSWSIEGLWNRNQHTKWKSKNLQARLLV
jgi:hypothetical protein